MATLYVLYGSATGNAEHIAKDLASKTPPTPFARIQCDAMEKFKKYSNDWLAEPVGVNKHGVILITSTTGNGDAPENASRFVRYLKRKTTVDVQPFQNCNFAVLGLGDTNYDQFCASGKLVDRKVAELGGTRIKPLAMADEATGLEDVVEPWVDTVVDDMAKACTIQTAEEPAAKVEEATAASEPAVAKVPAQTLAPEPAVPKEPQQPVTDEPNKPEALATEALEPKQPQQVANTAVIAPPTKSSSPLFILYGSATGNAEHIAKDLAATYQSLLQNPDAKCFFKNAVCCELDQYKKKCLSIWEKEPPAGTKHGVVIVTSTTGNGDAPENASRFVRYIKRKTTVKDMPFKHVAYAVLGLGDTNYDQFCATGKIVDRKLAELGGVRAKPLAEADEATGLEDVVEPWTSSILVDITNACKGSNGNSVTLTAPVLSTRVDSLSTAEEEKKMDADVGTTTTVNVSVQSRGVESVCALLGLKSCAIPTVDHSSLPSLGSSLSSCQLIHEEEDSLGRRRSRGVSLAEMDHMTISTASSTAIHYTISRPYEPTVLNARYLTNTKTDAAAAVCEAFGERRLDEDETMIKSMEIFDKHFPLASTNGEVENNDAFERNGKRVIEMTLALPDDYTLEYKPGDSLGLVVPNTPPAVRFVLDMLRKHHNIESTQKVSVDSNHPITVAEAVKHHVDLCSPLKSKRILHSLSQFATDPNEECVLRLLASKTPEGEKLYDQYVDGQRMSVVDLLREFPSCQGIPLEGLLGILPGIPPRYYSVSSSPLDKRKQLSLTVAFSVVDYLTPQLLSGDKDLGTRRIGGIATRYLEVLCSPFLSGKASTDGGVAPKLKVFPKPTAEFQLPATLSTPLILVGPGTGIAPFMGFLAHRKAQISARESTDAANSVVEGTWRGDYEMEAHDLPISHGDAKGLNLGVDYRTNQDVGPVHVFFGCRHENHDWLYREEMEQFRDEGVISNLHTAFSRDGPQRCYVQDLMRNDCAVQLTDLLLRDNASVYVCGDGNAMGRDVQSAIVDLIAQRKNGNLGEAKEYLEKMKVHKRFVLDIWTS